MSQERLGWFLAILLLAMGIGAQGANFTASLDRDTVNLGENTTLSLTFEGGQPATEPVPPNVANLQIANAGTSTRTRVIQGQFSSSVTYSFVLTPRQAGEYVIPPVTLEVSGQQLSSQPLRLRVLKPVAPPPGAVGSGSQLAFIRLVLPKTNIYVGETIVGQVQIYLHSRVRNISGFQVTAAPEGLNVGKFLQGQVRQVQISNAIYAMLPLNTALTAVKAGTFPSTTLTASAVLDVQTANRRRDPFFEMFGGGTEQQQVALATDPLELALLPLPKENMPPAFNGAVGSYLMNVTAGPTNVTAGDPITVKVQIMGRGSIDNLNLPDQPGWEHFKTFPPTSKVDTTDQLGLEGSKTFERIVSPESADVKALPAIGFSFFDPENKLYRTLTQPPLALLVRPGASPVAPTIVAAGKPQDDSPAAQDIVPNKQRLGTLAQIGPPLIQRPWFIALQGIPVLAFVSLLVWRRQADSLARNPRLRRQREVAVTVANGLGRLRSLAAEKKSDEFFATVFHLLQEQLGERLDLPSSAITEAVVEERLRPRGVAEAIVAALQELFHTCNVARYAPVKTSQELEALIPRLEQVLRAVAALKL